MRSVSLVLIPLLLAGCASSPRPSAPPDPDPTPAVNQVAPEPPAPATGPTPQPAVQPPEIVANGEMLRLRSASLIGWAGSDQLLLASAAGTGRLTLSDRSLEPFLPGVEGLTDIWRNHLSPNQTGLVRHGKLGATLFVNLQTGAEHAIEAPRFYGANIFSSWAPSGERYLLPSTRQDPVPGFYFLDQNGAPAGSWSEPGYFSHRATWSPDSSQVAFLSVPMGTTYPHGPEEWDEPPFAPRVGILDLQNMQARYADLGDQVAFGIPLWSPDGRTVAISCGNPEVEAVSYPPKTYQTVTLRESQVCLVDSATATVTRQDGDWRPEPVDEPVAFSPDGSALAVRTWVSRKPEERSLLLAVGTEPPLHPVELPGKAIGWVDDDRLLVHTTEAQAPYTERLLLIDRRRLVQATLAEGTGLTQFQFSPDRRHLAFAGREGESSFYLAITPIPPPGLTDLTGDGAPERLEIRGRQVRVLDATGAELLRYEVPAEVVSFFVWPHDLGAPLPALVVHWYQAPMEAVVFAYRPATAKMERVGGIAGLNLALGKQAVSVCPQPCQTLFHFGYREGEWRRWSEALDPKR